MSKHPNDNPLRVAASANHQTKYQGHLEALGGWEILMPGEESRRPKELKRVAYTRAEIAFDTEENLSKFLAIIKKSDERLSKIPDCDVKYDWQVVVRRGLTVRFGVAWYQEEFFHQRKDAHLSALHEGIFAQFGASSASLKIEHQLL